MYSDIIHLLQQQYFEMLPTTKLDHFRVRISQEFETAANLFTKMVQNQFGHQLLEIKM